MKKTTKPLATEPLVKKTKLYREATEALITILNRVEGKDGLRGAYEMGLQAYNHILDLESRLSALESANKRAAEALNNIEGKDVTANTTTT